eukprot:8285843-Pyramimonas_sp.AAC.2
MEALGIAEEKSIRTYNGISGCAPEEKGGIRSTPLVVTAGTPKHPNRLTWGDPQTTYPREQGKCFLGSEGETAEVHRGVARGKISRWGVENDRRMGLE